MKWTFNLEKAPWWGGIFERLVRSVKRCLKKTIGGATLTYEELLTAVVEVEMILNGRPLSYVSGEDTEEPLTPSHLLCGRRLMSLPDSNTSDTPYYDIDVQPQDLSRRMQHPRQEIWHSPSRKTLGQFSKTRHFAKVLSRFPVVKSTLFPSFSGR